MTTSNNHKIQSYLDWSNQGKSSWWRYTIGFIVAIFVFFLLGGIGMIPLALAGQGEFLTQKPSLHTLTNMAVIKQSMGVEFNISQVMSDAWLISLS